MSTASRPKWHGTTYSICILLLHFRFSSYYILRAVRPLVNKVFFTRCRRSGLPTKKPPRFLSDESGEILFPETIFLIVAVVVIAVVLGMAVCCLICVFVFCSVFRTVCLFAVLSVHIP